MTNAEKDRKRTELARHWVWKQTEAGRFLSYYLDARSLFKAMVRAGLYSSKTNWFDTRVQRHLNDARDWARDREDPLR